LDLLRAVHHSYSVGRTVGTIGLRLGIATADGE